MKKLLLLLLFIAVAFSCQKKDEPTTAATTDVVFAVTQVTPGTGLKSADGWQGDEWECATDGLGNLLEPVSAEIDILDVSAATTTTYFPSVYRLDGKLHTQAIKLNAIDGPTKEYKVTKFLLLDANGTTIMATPAAGSDYSEYTSIWVDFPFTVNAFEKAEVPVEVICYLPEDHDFFGFTWFEITEIVIREFCFFGDICLNGDPYSPDDFNGDPFYDPNNDNNLPVDVPAIMKIVVKKDDVEVPNSPFYNADYQGTGMPLCVQYPDDLTIDGEVFIFDLYVLVPDGSGGFSYQLYYTFTSTDDGDLDVDSGDDGILDFVIGTCNYNPDPNNPTTDLELPWLLPGGDDNCETAFAYNQNYATCFYDLTIINANRWGWTNGPLSQTATPYLFEIWAAAGQCNLSAGTLVGSLSLLYQNDEAVVTYSMSSGFTLDQVHIYVGNDVLPKKQNGDYTVAPGQYPHVAEDLNGVTIYTYTFDNMTGSVNLVAHAVVCGNY